jgi:nitric oxide reductase activation protein
MEGATLYRFAISVPNYKSYYHKDTNTRSNHSLYRWVLAGTSESIITAIGEHLAMMHFQHDLSHKAKCRACSGEDLSSSDCVRCEAVYAVDVPSEVTTLPDTVQAFKESAAKFEEEQRAHQIKQEQAEEADRKLAEEENAEIEAVKARYHKRRTEAE